MEKIKNIIFDLGAVILDIDYNLTRTAFEKLGVTHFDSMYSQADANELFQKLETGSIGEEYFHKQLNEITGLQLSPKEINTAWNQMLLSFRETSLDFLDAIKNKYRIFLLSNTNQIHINAFTAIYKERERPHTFEAYFEKAFYSSDIGFRKPDAGCFEWVLNEINVHPEETFFIDDSIQNIETAEKLGIKVKLLKAGEMIENLGL